MIEFRRVKVFGDWHDVSKKIKVNTENLGNMTIGVHEDAQDYQDGTNTAVVASKNEFGEGTTPARYWLRKSIRAEDGYLMEKFKGIARLFKGNAQMVKIAMRELGRRLIEKVKAHVWKNDVGILPNAPATIEKKGGDTPMIDTQHMIRQVDYKIAKLKDVK